MVGIGVSSVVPLVLALAGRSTTMAPGVAIAAVSTVGFLGFLLGPPLIGFISQATDLRWAFALIALFSSGITLLAGKAGQFSGRPLAQQKEVEVIREA
jgi:MFS family permease